MIAGIFHQGSGLGNQLHRYVMARVLALDRDYEFGMINPHFFKGNSFMHLDMGYEVNSLPYSFEEKRVNNNEGVDIRGYDRSINEVKDNTMIDGEFQGEKYFEHRKDEIREWLKVEPVSMPDDVCVINFRGGEYRMFPDLFLTKEYWELGMKMMRELNPKMRFVVHTDDDSAAREFFPDLLIVSGMELNWRSIRYAKYLLLSNSSFAILPALINQDAKKIIAPRYWARRNKEYWALPQNEYKDFTYI